MSERIEMLRQKAREEAAERELSFIHANRTTGMRHDIGAAEHSSAGIRWFGGVRSLGGIRGGDIENGGQIVADRSPCPRCGIRSDIGCKHRRPA
ncbi:hypothetical protein [Novosphingobium sp. EMRT-2]|uniref:hypothetical protein n=1 Tax=Novosphingobium sp. EMRT-2 TaxID=2571749 RepID=UPI0010BD2958|nr:hypothetical protein [Novosphingobium sp. EMRT-2]QCI93368.1 hypothetical protein FA702_07245 [Novosphingobium sp. EMRT-2]